MSFPAKAAWVLLFLILSLCLAIEPLFLIKSDESAKGALITLWYISVLLLLGSVLLLGSAYLGNRVFAAALSLAFTTTLFCLKLNFYAVVSGLRLSLYVVVIITIITILWYTLRKMLVQNARPHLLLFLLPAIVFISPLAQHLIQGKTKSEVISGDTLSEWGEVKISSKPNIYLLGYDTLIARDSAIKFLDMGELPYQAVIDKYFSEVPRALSPWVPTMGSINSIMRLDQNIQNLSYVLFSGRKPSILSEMMRSNGYKVTTGFTSHFFGKQGPYIDSYISTEQRIRLNEMLLCVESTNNPRLQARMLFICPVYNLIGSRLPGSSIANMLFPGEFSGQAGMKMSWKEVMMDAIRQTGSGSQPSLSFFYTYYPIGHTNLTYRHDDPIKRESYREYFKTAAQELNQQLEELSQLIRVEDPTAIVIIFGDHGTFVSRGLDPDTDPRFFYQDRHRILVASMKTKNPCSNLPIKTYTQKHATPSRLLLDTLVCLGASKSKLDQLLDFDEPEEVLFHALN